MTGPVVDDVDEDVAVCACGALFAWDGDHPCGYPVVLR